MHFPQFWSQKTIKKTTINHHKLCQVTTAGAFGAREMWPVDQLHMPTLFCWSDPKKSWHSLWWVFIVDMIYAYIIYMHHYAYFGLGILNKFMKHMRGVEPGLYSWPGGANFPHCPSLKMKATHPNLPEQGKKTWLTWAPKETKYFLSPIFTADFAGASCCGLMKIPLMFLLAFPTNLIRFQPEKRSHLLRC